MRGDEANCYNRLAKPTLCDAAVTAARAWAIDIFSRTTGSISATDDQPFFFRFFKWSLLPQLAALRGRGGFVFVDAGHLVVVLALLQAVIASAILILAPLAWLRRGEARRAAPNPLRVALYFLL